jgi:hypothetical protein
MKLPRFNSKQAVATHRGPGFASVMRGSAAHQKAVS